ncbi:MAG TPA: hypothetical protein EYN91_04775 [Candidatus Melainabacteria bacterium]|nr:hypothetical protein [Candidatus Melainabacteria bacterium]HIN67330.1 hypothetical protein [Candidatus Obscuribacterales bacterium]
MGSSKKTSKSEAATQSAECVAVCDVELKVDGPEDEAEQPAIDNLPAANDAPAKNDPPETNDSPVVSDLDASLAKTSENKEPVSEQVSLFESPVERRAASTSLPPSGIPLSIKPEMSTEWPFTRKRQVFNVFYFGLISFQLLALTKSGVAPGAAYFCLALCGFLTTASVFYLFNHRHHQTSSEEFSPRVRRSLRAVGLLLPAFLMFALARTELPISDAQNSIEEFGIPATVLAPAGGDFAREMAQGKKDFKRHRYNEALTHFENATKLDPSSDVAYSWVAEANDSLMNLRPALAAAMRAIELNPSNEQAYVVGAHYYNVTGDFAKARELAQRAVFLNPEDGEAYGYLSTAYNGLGNPVKALENDNNHVRWHYYEARAFEQRASTLDKLGRHNEATYDREIAKKVREVGVR